MIQNFTAFGANFLHAAFIAIFGLVSFNKEGLQHHTLSAF